MKSGVSNQAKCLHSTLSKGNCIRVYIIRLLSIMFSLVVLIASIPILFFWALFIRVESRGPVIYKQKRIGQNGRIFTMYKLRSMYINDDESTEKWTEKDDPRITKIGRVLRKTRIDEIPQFFNILKGDMNIIGPRPERPNLHRKFEKELIGFNERLIVKPGITGWAQVNGGYNLTVKQKLEKDLYYIHNQSLLLDLAIILKTIKVIFTFEGAR